MWEGMDPEAMLEFLLVWAVVNDILIFENGMMWKALLLLVVVVVVVGVRNRNVGRRLS